GGRDVEWRDRLPVFAAAFACACVLMRATRFVIDLAKDRDVVWKKLDEEDPAASIPRKTFTALYKAVSSSKNPRRFIAAADFYFRHRTEILSLASTHPEMTALLLLLEAEEPTIERRRSDALKRLFAYRWFSFLRRHRSAWSQVMFGLFKASGSAIAELRQPGLKPAGAPKRITAALRNEILSRAKPGDVFVTRHDDALSNLFLPGFWPHAVLYLGTRADLENLGVQTDPPESPAGHWFLESKKDGVKIRACEETLEIDACVVLRSPVGEEMLAAAIRRALSHTGKPYDFLFDFRTQDRLACTEVIYRGFHGSGPITFHLEEVGGRLCLPAEEMLNQALDCGFRIVATAGLGNGKILSGTKAEIAFHGSRQPL
ncbi:MAG TPA: YiiX/YebB-like N1pC/P60 family cysteine hydrolase, partial [Luteolibacter sp.]|nr:YiiX/YebB-like N1pC/P60 family cysteine hydrolase [Luteolibacter sp.]